MRINSRLQYISYFRTPPNYFPSWQKQEQKQKFYQKCEHLGKVGKVEYLRRTM